MGEGGDEDGEEAGVLLMAEGTGFLEAEAASAQSPVVSRRVFACYRVTRRWKERCTPETLGVRNEERAMCFRGYCDGRTVLEFDAGD